MRRHSEFNPSLERDFVIVDGSRRVPEDLILVNEKLLDGFRINLAAIQPLVESADDAVIVRLA